MLEFQPVSLGIKTLVDSYTFRWGEGSCQHSFVSSFCLRHKYGDMFCEHEGFLYTLRSRKCTDSERVYLFPHGDRTEVARAVQAVLDDAHEHGARARFETVTRDAMEIICGTFPGMFTAEGNRDLSEYVYDTEFLAELPGHEFGTKRKNIHKFFRDYEGRCEVLPITQDNIERVLAFQAEWLEAKMLGEEDFVHEEQLEQENDAVSIALNNFIQLGLSGIMLLIDGEVKGYSYGVPLNSECFDHIAEKGDRRIPNIYKVLKNEFVRRCCAGCKYVNLEEDLGVEGLRTMKQRYKPAFMMDKFILRENEQTRS